MSEQMAAFQPCTKEQSQPQPHHAQPQQPRSRAARSRAAAAAHSGSEGSGRPQRRSEAPEHVGARREPLLAGGRSALWARDRAASSSVPSARALLAQARTGSQLGQALCADGLAARAGSQLEQARCAKEHTVGRPRRCCSLGRRAGLHEVTHLGHRYSSCCVSSAQYKNRRGERCRPSSRRPASPRLAPSHGEAELDLLLLQHAERVAQHRDEGSRRVARVEDAVDVVVEAGAAVLGKELELAQ
jgi:hypothetical protein